MGGTSINQQKLNNMLISTLIEKLEALQKEHGDLRVTTVWFHGGVEVLHDSKPCVREIRKKRGRESKTYYKESWDKEEVIEKVVQI